MFDKVITTERNIKNALSKLISNDPYEQLNWVEENECIEAILNLRSVGEELYAASDIPAEYVENFLPEYLIAPMFMVAIVGKEEGPRNSVRKYIADLEFCETVGDIYESLIFMTEDTLVMRSSIHLFMFKMDEGYVEIPFDIGYYIPKKPAYEIEDVEEQLVDHINSNIYPKLPYRVILGDYDLVDVGVKNYEWSTKFNKRLMKSGNTKCFFIDIPGVWEVTFFDELIEPERQVYHIWSSERNIEDVINRVAMLMKVRFDGESCPEIRVHNEWVSYRFVYNSKETADWDFEEDGFEDDLESIDWGNDTFLENVLVYRTIYFD